MELLGKLACNEVRTNTGRWAGDYFGRAVGVWGDTLVVGAYLQDYDASGGNALLSAGAAHVFTRVGGVWEYQQKLIPTGTNARSAYDYFGYSVGIDSDTIVVGAYAQDYNATGSTYIADGGACYVFTRSGTAWLQQAKLVGSGTNGRIAYDNLGTSVSVHGDTVVAGAPYQDYDENGSNSLTDAGAAYVFTRSGTLWSQQQKIVASGVNGRISNDYFGYGGIGVYSDTIVVGSYYHDYDESGSNYLSNASACFIFTRSGTVWSQQQKICGSGVNGRVAGDYFGYSAGIFSDTVVVGAYGQDYDSNGSNYYSTAGAVYVFTRSGTVWSQQQKICGSGVNGRLSSDYFGISVGIWSETVVVGAYYHRYDNNGTNYIYDAGAVYVFTRSGTLWSQQQKLVSSGANGRLAGNYLGISAIHGETVVAGAHGADYDGDGSNYMPEAGAAYIFTRSGSSWLQEQKIASASGPYSREGGVLFGISSAVYGDTVVVGSIYYSDVGSNAMESPGGVFVFVRNNNVWELQQKLIPSGTNARYSNDNFGVSVGIFGDTIVVGAQYQDWDASGANYIGNAGAAYIFTRSGTVWLQQAKLVATGVNGRIASDYFGRSVGIYSDSVVVGAYGQDYDASGANSASAAGACYVFTRSGTLWSQQAKLVASGVNGRVAGDYLGVHSGIYGDTIVTQSYYQCYDENGSNSLTYAGAAYVFTRSGTVWSLQQKLVASGVNGRKASDYFGYSLGIYSETIVVCAVYQDFDESGSVSLTDAGAAYVFTRNGTVWAQQQKLVGTGVNGRRASDYFGSRVGIDGDRIAVGAYYQSYDSNGSNLVNAAGACYVFTRNDGVWSQEQKLVASGVNSRQSYDYFGMSVGMQSETVVVGAYYNNYDEWGSNIALDAGAAYVFGTPKSNGMGLSGASDNSKMKTRYWLGVSSDWGDVANWSSSDGGSGGVSVPGVNNLVIIESGTVVLDRNVNIGGLVLGGGVLDCAGYQLNCGDVVMGGGEIYFRGGEHQVRSLECSGGTIHWGSRYVGVSGHLDIRGLTSSDVGVWGDLGNVEMNGVGNQDIWCGGKLLPHLVILKGGGVVRFRDLVACRSLENLEGVLVNEVMVDIYDRMVGFYP